MGYERENSARSRSNCARPRGNSSPLSSAGSAQPSEADLLFSQVSSIEVAQNTAPIFTYQEPVRSYISSRFTLPQQQPNPQPNEPSTHRQITTRAYGNNLEVEPMTNDRNDLEMSYGYGNNSSHPVIQATLIQKARRHIDTNLETNVGYHLPPQFVPDPQTSGLTIKFILSQYESLFELVFFRPIKNQIDSLQGRFVARIMSSKITHWSMYIGAQMFRALRQDRECADVKRFVPYLDRLGQLSIASKNDVSLDDLTGRLAGGLELAFLKHLTSSAKSTYTLLRHIAPIFMQVAFADPTLWPRDPSSSGISLSHVLSSSQYDLGRFVFIDTTTSLMFGTPPLVEYDTSHPITRSKGEHPLDWIHGWPPEFVFSIMRINQWRAQHPDSCSGEDSPWEEIEADTQTWRPASDCDSTSESLRLVTKFVVQESWRHLLLIYLYMGMCGVTSHDPRVQYSMRQISRLHATISSQCTAEVHLMIPFLFAGACARGEADRRKFRMAVSQSGRMKTWLLKSVSFEHVLDHLWHGVGANGGPITWDDYVTSRKAVIDIGV